jgi:hypothetical protein
MLRDEGWLLVADVSGEHIGPIFEVQAAQKPHPRCVTSQTDAGFNHTVAEAWYLAQ